MTKVLFRKWPASEGGDVIALFPELAGDYNPGTCSSYQRVGQHGAADLLGLTHKLRKATAKEYRPLATELQRLGYRLKVISRVQSGMLAMRKAQLEN